MENAALLLTENEVKHFISVCLGQKQILPQKPANKRAISQNNGVVMKWSFSLNIKLGSETTPLALTYHRRLHSSA